MKILHFSDSHLGYMDLDKVSSNGVNLREQDVYDAFAKVIDQVLEIRPDLVLHSGDFFHRPSPANRPLIFAVEQLHRLSEANIPIVIIAGNHSTPKTIYTSPILRAFRSIEGVYPVFQQKYETVRFGNLVVHGLPHINDEAVLLTEMDKIEVVQDHWNILMMHTSVGKRFLMEEYGERLFPEKRMDLLNKFDYVALGHWHNFQKVEMLQSAWYSGSTERMSDTETGHDKGFCIIDLKNGQKVIPEFFPVEVRPWYRFDVKSCAQKSVLQIKEELLSQTADISLKDALVSIYLYQIEPLQGIELSLRALHELLGNPVHIYLKRDFLLQHGQVQGFEGNPESLRSLMELFIRKSVADEKKAAALAEKAMYYFELYESGEYKNL